MTEPTELLLCPFCGGTAHHSFAAMETIAFSASFPQSFPQNLKIKALPHLAPGPFFRSARL